MREEGRECAIEEWIDGRYTRQIGKEGEGKIGVPQPIVHLFLIQRHAWEIGGWSWCRYGNGGERRFRR